ncbi:hypothetical protein ACWCQQ_32825 [Streptomyces sp. NPDC002143]
MRSQAAKNEAGFDQHEVRKWISWYRQTTVYMIALVFLADVRCQRIRPHQPAPLSSPTQPTSKRRPSSRCH